MFGDGPSLRDAPAPARPSGPDATPAWGGKSFRRLDPNTEKQRAADAAAAGEE